MEDRKQKQQAGQAQAPKAPVPPATGGQVPPQQKLQTGQAQASKMPAPPPAGGPAPTQATVRMSFAALNSPAVAEAVKTALRRVPGVEEVAVDLATRTVTVKGRNLRGGEITSAVEGLLKTSGPGTPSTPQTPPSKSTRF